MQVLQEALQAFLALPVAARFGLWEVQIPQAVLGVARFHQELQGEELPQEAARFLQQLVAVQCLQMQMLEVTRFLQQVLEAVQSLQVSAVRLLQALEVARFLPQVVQHLHHLEGQEAVKLLQEPVEVQSPQQLVAVQPLQVQAALRLHHLEEQEVAKLLEVLEAVQSLQAQTVKLPQEPVEVQSLQQAAQHLQQQAGMCLHHLEE